MVSVREPDSSSKTPPAGPGVAAEQALSGGSARDVDVTAGPEGVPVGPDYSQHPFPAGGVTIDAAPGARAAALKALISVPEDRLAPIPAQQGVQLPGRGRRDYRANDADGVKVYRCKAVRFNAAVGGDVERKIRPNFIMCVHGDTVALTDAEAKWGLSIGAIEVVDDDPAS